MPDANALDTHDRVLAQMAELSESFPEGLSYDVRFHHRALHARIDP